MSRNILAGSTSSTSLARAALIDPVIEVAEFNQQAVDTAPEQEHSDNTSTGQHVDDVCQKITGNSEHKVYQKAVGAATGITERIQKPGASSMQTSR